MKQKIEQLKAKFRRVWQSNASSSVGLKTTKHWLISLGGATVLFFAAAAFGGFTYYGVTDAYGDLTPTLQVETLPLEQGELDQVVLEYAQRAKAFNNLRTNAPIAPEPVVDSVEVEEGGVEEGIEEALEV